MTRSVSPGTKRMRATIFLALLERDEVLKNGDHFIGRNATLVRKDGFTTIRNK